MFYAQSTITDIYVRLMLTSVGQDKTTVTFWGRPLFFQAVNGQLFDRQMMQEIK